MARYWLYLGTVNCLLWNTTVIHSTRRNLKIMIVMSRGASASADLACDETHNRWDENIVNDAVNDNEYNKATNVRLCLSLMLWFDARSQLSNTIVSRHNKMMWTKPRKHTLKPDNCKSEMHPLRQIWLIEILKARHTPSWSFVIQIEEKVPQQDQRSTTTRTLQAIACCVQNTSKWLYCQNQQWLHSKIIKLARCALSRNDFV